MKRTENWWPTPASSANKPYRMSVEVIKVLHCSTFQAIDKGACRWNHAFLEGADDPTKVY